MIPPYEGSNPDFCFGRVCKEEEMKKTSGRVVILCMCLAVLFIAPSMAPAVPIEFVWTGIGPGILEGLPFEPLATFH